MRAAGALVVALVAVPTAVSAQLTSAELSTDTVGFGDRFDLLVDVHVPPGAVVHVPVSVGETELVGGVGAVEWSAASAADGGADVSLRYGVLPYAVGIVELPSIALFTSPSDTADGDDRVATYSADGGGIELLPDMDRIDVPSRSVWVSSVLRPQDVEQGLEPRPADDVVGPSWNAAAVLSALVFASALLAVGFVSGRDWWSAHGGRLGRPPSSRDVIAAARAAALAELDALISVGCGDDPEAIEAVYEGSSAVVRRYVERLEAAWGPAYTSTELMRGLEASRGGRELDPLLSQMALAEVVKFGRLRPTANDAVEHCRELRRWVAAS